ncbi:MAG: hypothetical protein K0R98_346 [Rickettsiaceae bacterium]|jgi:hypothetical protein|nr:hypothetical protein [Rickettsiaceae bacterium]
MSKNNPSKRGKAIQRTYAGKPVKPVKYIGKRAGHGNYMAVQFIEGGAMAMDNAGKPLMWDAIN